MRHSPPLYFKTTGKSHPYPPLTQKRTAFLSETDRVPISNAVVSYQQRGGFLSETHRVAIMVLWKSRWRYGAFFYASLNAARTASRWPALPNFSFLCAMKSAYAATKTLPGGRRSKFSG